MTRESKINLSNLNYHNKRIILRLVYNIYILHEVFETLEAAGAPTTEE